MNARASGKLSRPSQSSPRQTTQPTDNNNNNNNSKKNTRKSGRFISIHGGRETSVEGGHDSDTYGRFQPATATGIMRARSPVIHTETHLLTHTHARARAYTQRHTPNE